MPHSHAVADRAWPFPFRDSDDGRLSKRWWLTLVVSFVAIHYLVLGLSFWSGNFDPNPNHDHVHVMRDVLESGRPEVAIWPPAFGYYMALKWRLTAGLGLPYWTGKLIVDVFLFVASGILATLLGQALTRNRWLAAGAGIGQTGAPIFALSSAEGLAVLLFQPLFLVALLLLVLEVQRPAGPRAARIAVVGSFMGLACLVRSNPQFLFLVLVPFLGLALWDRAGHTARRLVLVLTVLFLAQTAVMSPWLVRQRQLGADGVFGAPVVYYAFFDGLKRHSGNPVSAWVEEHYEELEQSMSGVLQVNATWMERDPGALLRLYMAKFIRAWYLSDSGRWDTYIILLHAPIWLLAIAGVVVWLRRAPSDPAVILILTVILYMWTVSALVSGLARYSSPLYGLLGLLACVPFVSRGRTTVRDVTLGLD